MIKEIQVKSKKRVNDHGEVFTSKKEVEAMLELVKQETENIDSKFLEPACGTGNFLVEILERKLAVVKKRYAKNQIEYERYSILALMNIYGVELLLDNTQTCRDRLFGIFTHHYTGLFKKGKTEYLKTAEFIIERNVLCGDALTLKTSIEQKPIVFTEWSFARGSLIQRRDFIFEELIIKNNSDLFHSKELSDDDKLVFIPRPIKEYPLIHFLELAYGN